MDSLGAAANVFAVLDMSTKVIGLCARYAINVKNAKEDKSRFLNELHRLHYVSQQMKALLDGPRAAKLKASSELELALLMASSQLQQIDAKLSSSSSSWKWPFRSEDLKLRLMEIGRCTQTISLALEVDQT